MAVNLSPVAGVAGQLFDNNGDPLTGGKIFTYASGTTTNQATYTNASGSVPHSNPIILDAAGRVPGGEIWLTDGLLYKFVIKDSSDVLIGTYDNVAGINSNFVNFTNQQEIQTATAGQTVFTLTTTDYQPGTNSLSVFVDGVNQYGPGASYAYLETNSTTVTFITGLHVGAEVKFTTSQLNSTAGNDAALVSYVPPFVGSVGTNVAAKLAQTVSVKDFGAVGDGVADDTAAIQAAIDGQVRNIKFPAGQYKITSSLILQQGIMLFGDGSNNEIDTYEYCQILSNGDFDALVLNTGAPGYYGYLTIKNINIVKSSGSVKTNSGLKIGNFAPHVVLESVQIEGFNIGFDMYTGLAQINSCNARLNNTGFEIKCTSSVFQNCYSNRNTTGYRFKSPSVYSSLIGCAADTNTGNAYEFIGTTGPFNSDNNSADDGVITMISCGSEASGRYLYVDGNFSIEVVGPTTAAMTTAPFFAYIESAKRVYFKQIEAIGNFQWLFVNKTKNTPDVVAIEGDMAFRSLGSPPTALFTQVPTATESFKTVVGVPQFGRTRIPSLESLAIGGAGTGGSSFIYKSLFESQSLASNSIRFRVKVYGNGFATNALIKASQFRFINGSASDTANLSLNAQNISGITTLVDSSSGDFTFLQAQSVAIDGFTYAYFFVRSSFNVSYLWDIQATTNFQNFNAEYSNWTVQQANVTTTGNITSGTAALTVASGVGIVDGMQIIVVGAGTAGADLLTTVSSGGGTTSLTLAANASTTVTGAAVSAYSL